MPGRIDITILDRPGLAGDRKTMARPRRRPQGLGRRRLPINPFWDFFDLGTRLRTVATPSDFITGVRALTDTSAVNTDVTRFLEYVEMFFASQGTINMLQGPGVPLGEQDVYNFGQFHIQVDPDNPSEVASWDARLIDETDGTPPFGTTKMNHTGARNIPNCLPIKFHGRQGTARPHDVFDVETYVAGQTETEFTELYLNSSVAGIRAYRLGKDFGGGFLTPEWETPDDPLAVPPVSEIKPEENWNPLSLDQALSLFASIDIESRGRLNVEDKQGDIHIRLKSPNTFESFDTGDTTNFKITTTPNFSAQEVAFETKAATPLKFYLKPRWFGFYRLKNLPLSSVSWQYETYRVSAGDGTYWNGWLNPSSSNLPGQPVYNVTLTPITPRVPDNPIADGTATFTFNRDTGEYSVTGVPGGDLSGVAPITIPGFRGGNVSNAWYQLIVSFSTAPGGVQVVNAAYSIIWSSFGGIFGSPTNDFQNFGISQSYVFQVGGHVGRIPAFPRMVRNANWSFLFPPSDNPRTYSDGSTKLWEQSVADAFIGQSLTVPSGGTDGFDLARAYKRHPERDKEGFLGLRSNIGNIRVPPETGSFSAIDVIKPTQGQRTSVAGISSVISSHQASMVTQVTNALSGPHFRNVVIGESPGSLNNGNICLVPLDLPVGALCGVIVKGGTKYYIWRKTPETRRTFDYDRRQMQFSNVGGTFLDD